MTPVYLEVGRRRSFACAVDWPGWERSGRDEEAALDNLARHHRRYAEALERVGLVVPEPEGFDVVGRVEGDATTDFGAPGAVTDVDRRPVTATDLSFLQSVLRAGWLALEAAAGAAVGPLAKGPRGGGRQLEAVVAHVIEAERGYAPKLGVRGAKLDSTDAEAVAGFRRSILERVATPPPGSKWPVRYFVRRTAWHALDHAWEIENRSPAGRRDA